MQVSLLFVTVITAIAMSMAALYFYNEHQKETIPHPIGAYDNKKMTETLDVQADKGILPIAEYETEESEPHTPEVPSQYDQLSPGIDTQVYTTVDTQPV